LGSCARKGWDCLDEDLFWPFFRFFSAVFQGVVILGTVFPQNVNVSEHYITSYPAQPGRLVFLTAVPVWSEPVSLHFQLIQGGRTLAGIPRDISFVFAHACIYKNY
jgi:hypothetical protein